MLLGNIGAHYYSGNINPTSDNTTSDCNICNYEVDTKQGLQCDTCDIWIHPACINVNKQELEIYIPFLCPTCEWGETDPSDVESEVFNGSDININTDSN